LILQFLFHFYFNCKGTLTFHSATTMVRHATGVTLSCNYRIRGHDMISYQAAADTWRLQGNRSQHRFIATWLLQLTATRHVGKQSRQTAGG